MSQAGILSTSSTTISKHPISRPCHSSRSPLSARSSTRVLVVVAMDIATGMEIVFYRHQQRQHIHSQHHCQHHVRYQRHCKHHVIPPLSIVHTFFPSLQACILPLSSFHTSMMMKGCCLLIRESHFDCQSTF